MDSVYHRPAMMGIASTAVKRTCMKSDRQLRLRAFRGRLSAARTHERDVYFGDRFRRCPVLARDRLVLGETIAGPAIVEEAGSTTRDRKVRREDGGDRDEAQAVERGVPPELRRKFRRSGLDGARSRARFCRSRHPSKYP